MNHIVGDYNGKEFIEMHGLDEYDSKARWYYPAIARTTTMDPHCEKYYDTSPYAWCKLNPILYYDSNGKDTKGGVPGYYTKGIWVSARSTTYLPQKKNIRNIKMSDNVYREMIFKQTIKNQGVIRPTYTKESYLTHYSDFEKGMMSNPVVQSVAAGGLAATVIPLATDAIQSVAIPAVESAKTLAITKLYPELEKNLILQFIAGGIEGSIKVKLNTGDFNSISILFSKQINFIFMKKLFLLVFVFLQSIFTFGQLKVLSSGKTLIGGTTGTVTGDIQLNLQSGSTHGLTFYNPNSSQNYRLTIDGSSLLLSYNSLSLGYFLSGFNVGGSSNLYEYGGCLNISPYGNDNLPYSLATVANQTYGLALFARNDYSGSTGAGISILSTVGKTADMTFASSLNNSSSYSFYVLGDGSAYTKNVLVTSDETLKTDIKAITTPLSKILKLRGVEYKFIDEEIKSTIAKDESPTGSVTDTIKRHKEYDVPKIDPAIVKVIENEQSEAKHIGFLAQEVEKVLPEVVRTSVNGTKAISYMDIIALLVEGIKEQQQTIETMQNEMTELKKSISNRESHNNRANIKKEYIGARLYQNTPNPFNQNTEIAYELPADTQNAVLYIYNMQGVQIEEYNISDFGVGSITIFGGHLEAGIYLYSLIADGKLIDTKQMVLTK